MINLYTKEAMMKLDLYTKEVMRLDIKKPIKMIASLFTQRVSMINLYTKKVVMRRLDLYT